MKKSKLAMLAATAALGGLMVVGGTLAWFTDTETATNVVTMGKIDIAITEDFKVNADERLWTMEKLNPLPEGSMDGVKYSGVMPGTIVDKIVTITNFGGANSNDAYVRAKIEIVTDSALDFSGIKYYTLSGEFLSGYMEENNKANFTAAEWKELIMNNKQEVVPENGYVYYDGILKSGTAWEYPIVAVEFPGAEWGNEYTDADFSIVITAEAIQADNIDVKGATGVAAAKEAFNHFVVKSGE